jgi:hypothetical protein
VTLKTIVTVVTMPGPGIIKLRSIGSMDSCVCPADAVEIIMTAYASTGWITAFMAGGAIFHILSRISAMIANPGGRGMAQRHPVVALVTFNTKSPVIMAMAAVGGFTPGVKAVSIDIVEVMYPAGQIITSMTFQTPAAFCVASFAILRIARSPFAMIMQPVEGMDTGQGQVAAVANGAIIGSFAAVMTFRTDFLFRKINRIGF